MIVQIPKEYVVFEKKIQSLCRLPYHGHSKGCPNYGKRETCPPGRPLIDEVFDLENELFAIYTSFPVGEFAERMRITHPEWSEHPRQWYNPRRWQGTARKEHRLELEKFLEEHPGLEATRYPEAHGVNVTAVMHNIGIKLDWEWPPDHTNYEQNLTYIVSIAGHKK